MALSGDFIVGFPGETEAEFAELLDYVRAARFELLGVFPYSLEPDTPAARLPNPIDEATRLDRRDRVMAAQQEIAFDFNHRLVGRTLDVLIDGPAADSRGDLWVGRTWADAPDVDGLVYVSGANLEPGDLVECSILAADGYDLVARPTAAAAPRRRRSRPKPRRKPGVVQPASPFTILN